MKNEKENSVKVGGKMTHRNFAYLGVLTLLCALLCRQIFPGPISVFNSSSPTVAIDPGHGKLDPGVIHEKTGVQEAPINLAVAHKLGGLLKADKINVVMTRDEKTQEFKGNRQELQRRVKVASDANADIYVSLHVNQFPDPQYFGAQCFYYPLSLESEKLAKLIQEELKGLEPKNFRKALTQDLFVLRECSMPSVVVEMGFISHPVDRAKLGDPQYQSALARAVYMGIKRYFKGESPKDL